MLLPAEVFAKALTDYFPQKVARALSLYSNVLNDLSEPSLCRLTENFPIYRLTYNRRVGFWQTITFYANPLKPSIIVHGGQLLEPKRAIRTRTFVLSLKDSKNFLSEIRSTGFWNSPALDKSLETAPHTHHSLYLDAEPWIVEGLDKGKYHVVMRDSTTGDCSRLNEIFYLQAKKTGCL
ncbi:MAG: hypothetical protein C0507_03875 [Cyanobacteria bacterium PR.3.49]|nr:hypothetical protein [Cyanobacteria bacterium PR.3.49]